MTQIITRFAPSPTGYLHIGGARTALFNYLFAKHMGGKFLLRIEDTDRARSTQAAVEAILDGMEWLGLKHDGEVIFQFARQARHAEVAKELLERGGAYYCYTTQAELDDFREKNPNAKFRSPWRNGGTPPAGVPPVIRLKAPLEGAVTVCDHVRGEVSVEAKELDDMVLLRADGTPTYMLAVVVDDHDMNVSHVIRGDDHFTNTFRQVLLYQAMGWNVPEFAHIPLIHGADGAKLSKRHGALGVDAYRDMGYLPEALRNYLLRLGWSHGDAEIISDEQAIEWFELEGLGNSPSRLDFDKLKSVNAHYMKAADPERLLSLLSSCGAQGAGTGSQATGRDPVQSLRASQDLVKALPWLIERASTLVELAEQAEFLIADRPIPMTEKADQIVTEAKGWLVFVGAKLEGVSQWNEANLKACTEAFMLDKGLKNKQFMPAMRAVLSGREASAGSIFQIMEALGKQETLGRLEDCV
jgi:glutamyl-tRNA synthetase